MHVLGLPPAFVLSQDQTLKLKASEDAILDRRTSAHLSPGACPGNLLFIVLTRVSRQTVKLTLSSSVSLESRYASDLRSYDQTARISLQIATMSNSREKTNRRRQISWRTTARSSQIMYRTFRFKTRSQPRPSLPSVPFSVSRRPVKGCLGPTDKPRNKKMHRDTKKFGNRLKKQRKSGDRRWPRTTPQTQAPRISHRITTAK